MSGDIDGILEQLRQDVGASRCTLRQNLDGSFAFPVTHEALGDGVPSLRGDVTVNASSAPSIRLLQRERGPVFVEDCAAAASSVDASYDDPSFRSMLDAYGGLAAFMVFPIFDGDDLAATIAVHHLGEPREWTDAQRATGRDAATRIEARITRPTTTQETSDGTV